MASAERWWSRRGSVMPKKALHMARKECLGSMRILEAKWYASSQGVGLLRAGSSKRVLESSQKLGASFPL
jgi:hypothetical protein